jgi:anti-sigma factor RsiW
MAACPSREDLVAYAIGGLDAREEERVREHAPGCARCTRELEALAPAVAVLAESVEQHEPSEELRHRVMAVVHEEAAAAKAPAPLARRRGLKGLLLRPVVTVVAVAVIVGGGAGYLIAQGGGGNDDDASTTVPVTSSQGIGGSLEVGEVSSMLRLHGMRQLSGAEVYQVWVAQGSKVRASSSFVPDPNGNAASAVDGRLGPGSQVMVTKEPRAGRTSPTLPVLLSATVD